MDTKKAVVEVIKDFVKEHKFITGSVVYLVVAALLGHIEEVITVIAVALWVLVVILYFVFKKLQKFIDKNWTQVTMENRDSMDADRWKEEGLGATASWARVIKMTVEIFKWKVKEKKDE